MTTQTKIDLSGTWCGTKGGRPAVLKDLELYTGSDGEQHVSYIFRLGGKQTGYDGGAGSALLSSFVGPKAVYHRRGA